MEVVIIALCALAIVGLTYLGAGAWLRDRRRNAERRPPSADDESAT